MFYSDFRLTTSSSLLLLCCVSTWLLFFMQKVIISRYLSGLFSACASFSSVLLSAYSFGQPNPCSRDSGKFFTFLPGCLSCLSSWYSALWVFIYGLADRSQNWYETKYIEDRSNWMLKIMLYICMIQLYTGFATRFQPADDKLILLCGAHPPRSAKIALQNQTMNNLSAPWNQIYWLFAASIPVLLYTIQPWFSK